MESGFGCPGKNPKIPSSITMIQDIDVAARLFSPDLELHYPIQILQYFLVADLENARL